MTKKRLISFFLSFLFVFFTFSSAFAASAGSAEDPLISKSYIDNTYTGLVLTDPLQALNDSMAALKYKLAQAAQTKGSGVSSVTAKSGGVISLSSGSGFVLVSGSVKLTSNSGTVIDLTDGSVVALGAALTAGHRYLAAEATSADVSVVTAAKISVFGSVSVSGGTAPSFTDVTEDKWFYGDVSYAVQKGLINGRSAALYAPDDFLSIAEAIKLAACMHQLYHSGSVSLVNDPTLWYKSYLDYATTNGIVTKTYANYDLKISRSEFVAVFYAALPSSEYTPKNTVNDNKIPDLKITATNAVQIYTFYRAGILTGSDAYGTFYPNNNIKRSEVAAILTRMFEADARKSITLQ